MTRAIFLAELERKLKFLPKEELESVMEYYNEYFDEAGKENEQKILEELKSPSHVASKILAEFASKELKERDKAKEVNKKKGANVVLFLLLALCAAPIALPILIAIIAVIFAVFITIGALAFAFVIVCIALFITGVVGLFAFPFVALMMIGSSLVFAGIAFLFFYVAKKLIEFILNKLSKK